MPQSGEEGLPPHLRTISVADNPSLHKANRLHINKEPMVEPPDYQDDDKESQSTTEVPSNEDSSDELTSIKTKEGTLLKTEPTDSRPMTPRDDEDPKPSTGR